MTDWLEIFSYGFVRNAILSAFFSSILSGILGVLLLIKKRVFLGAGITHISFGGLGIAYYLGWDPFLGAWIFALFSSLGLGLFTERRKQEAKTLHSMDAWVGVLWSLGMSLGALFLYFKPGFVPDLSGYLFGNILIVSETDLMWMAVSVVLTLFFFFFFYKELLALLFDFEFSSLRGVPVGVLNVLFYILLSWTIIVLVRVVGIVLVMALLTVPTLFAFLFSRSVLQSVLWAILSSFCFIMIGLVISYFFNVPSGASIVLPAVTLFFLAKLCIPIFQKKKS